MSDSIEPKDLKQVILVLTNQLQDMSAVVLQQALEIAELKHSLEGVEGLPSLVHEARHTLRTLKDIDERVVALEKRLERIKVVNKLTG